MFWWSFQQQQGFQFLSLFDVQYSKMETDGIAMRNTRNHTASAPVCARPNE
jgi:hypothetical protein